MHHYRVRVWFETPPGAELSVEDGLLRLTRDASESVVLRGNAAFSLYLVAEYTTQRKAGLAEARLLRYLRRRKCQIGPDYLPLTM